MHILLSLIAIVGAAAFWIWRMRAAAEASRELLDVADDVRSAVRRFGYRRKHGQHVAEGVDDARLAAAGMMAAIARLDGDLTAAQMNALRVECRATFKVDQGEADEIAAYGRWLAAQSKDPDDALWRLTRVMNRIAPREAHMELIPMLERVASVEGGEPNEAQASAIERARRGLGLI